jgi:hypothetical protein
VAEIPEEAVQAAAAAIERELMSGRVHGMAVDSDEALARAALEAAAPFIAAQSLIRERRRAMRLVRRRLVPSGCEPTVDAAELIAAIEGDLRV